MFRPWRFRLRTLRLATMAITLGCLMASCGSAADESTADEVSQDGDSRSVPSTGAPANADRLSPMMTWQWQLQGELNTSYDVDLYDIDLFDTSATQITELRDQGRYVVCYFSAGSFEDWREDADEFSADALGEALDGWEGERWIDVRSAEVRSVLEARLDLAAEKGCAGVEPDNVTAANNDTGFAITSEDQLDFNRFLADAAHARGLTIGLKNDLDQILELVDWFDFAVNEECFEYDECDVYDLFIDARKPVFNAEYAGDFVNDPEPVCERAAALGLATLILDLELDDSLRIACP